MRLESLEGLVCPSRNPRPCHGTLSLHKVLVLWEKDRKDLLEGVLACSRCPAQYPVLCGIAILHEDVPKYLRRNYPFIVGLCRSLGALSDPMRLELVNLALLDLKDPEEELFPNAGTYTRRAARQSRDGAGSYLLNHYGDPAALASPREPLYELLKGRAARPPHAVLADFLARHGNGSRGKALEVGCHVGGLTAAQARRFAFAYGVDLSFENLLLAGRILMARPQGMKHYRLHREGGRAARRRLAVEPCANVEFFLAAGASLPFRAESFDAVSSCNVIDIVPEPLKLLDEKTRVLKKGGLFLLADPYEFYGEKWKRLETDKRKTPLEIVKERLKARLSIIAEEDHVPWVSRAYQRGYMVYYSHCLAAIKRGETSVRR